MLILAGQFDQNLKDLAKLTIQRFLEIQLVAKAKEKILINFVKQLNSL